MPANSTIKSNQTVSPIKIINNQIIQTKPIMNKNNHNSQSQSENKRLLHQSPKTPTSITSTATSKKTKYLISPNRYSLLAEPDSVPTVNPYVKTIIKLISMLKDRGHNTLPHMHKGKKIYH
jgi:hypothetical protein